MSIIRGLCGELSNARSCSVEQATPNSSGNQVVLGSSVPVPGWAITYGREFWRRAIKPHEQKPEYLKGSPPTMMADINLGDIIDRVSHAISKDGSSAAPRVQAKTYSAAFDGAGLRFSPHRLRDREPATGEDSLPASLALRFECNVNGVGGSAAGERFPRTEISRIEPMNRSSGRESAPFSQPEGVSGRTSAATRFTGRLDPRQIGLREGNAPVEHRSQFPMPDPGAEVTLRTRSVRFADRVLYERSAQPLSWSLLGNTAQALLDERFGLVEHYETKGEGVELGWVLNQRPPGNGPLEIEVEMVGLNYAGTSAEGIHLADATGTPRVCIGKAVAVDFTGRRSEVTMTANGHHVVIVVPAAAVAEAAYPLAIDPMISPEFGMDQPVIVLQSGTHTAPVVASNGTNWLVVWAEQPRTLDFERPTTIAGARVSTEGIVLDPLGILISKPNLVPAPPAIASNGRDYLVVWQSSDFTTDGIHGVRVAADGHVVDPDEISVSTSPSAQLPAVAAGSEGYLVVWEERRSPADIDLYGTWVSEAGAVSDDFPVSTAPGDQRWPSVGCGPDGLLVVWMDSRGFSGTGYDVYGARLDVCGAVLDTNGIPISTALSDQWVPCVAANSTGYLVVWQDSRHSTTNAAQTDVYGTLVTPAGEVSNPQGILIRAAAGDWSNPGVASGADNFLVVWRDSRPNAPGIYASRVNSTGAILDSGGIQVVSGDIPFGSPKAAACDDSFLVVWDLAHETVAGFEPAVFGVRLNSQAKVEDSTPIAVTVKDSDETTPAIASNGTNWLVVWEDWRNPAGGRDIYGVRIGFNGTPLDTVAVPISTLPGFESTPAVASAGGDYLVVWRDDRNAGFPFPDIYGARVRGDGMVLDSAGIAICTAPGFQGARSRAVASDGTNYFVVWTDGRPNANGIYGARVSRSGVVLEPDGFLVSAYSAAAQSGPVVAFNGKCFLVVWDEWEVRYGASNDIYGVRVSPSGTVLDTNKLAISRAPNGQLTPAVASNRDDFFVIWDDSRNTPVSRGDIYGARITSAGVVLDTDGFLISPAASYSVPDLAFDGSDFVTVWHDSRPGATGVLTDTRGAWIDRSGGILLNHILINNDAGNPTIAAGTSNTFLVISEGLRNGTSRVLGKLVSFANTPVIQSLTLTGGVATLTWHAEAGKSYRAQFKRDLNNNNNWIDLDPVVTATNREVSILDTWLDADAKRFYRVRQLP